MERQKKTAAESGGVKSPRSAKKQITDKVAFIARSRDANVNDVWEELVAPVVQAEFEACGGAKPKASKAGAQ